MSEIRYPFPPLRLFLWAFIPAALGALGLGLLAQNRAPALAPALVMSLGYLGFVLAAHVAAVGHLPCFRPPVRYQPVLRLLDLRRNRLGYALGFAFCATAMAWLAPWAGAGLGLGMALELGFGQVCLVFGLLVPTGWLVIGAAVFAPRVLCETLMRGGLRREDPA